jgi:holliday junction DNA helicase RuvA
MIGKLKGLIDSYGDDFVIIDVNGVGYVAFCSGRTLQSLPRPGEAAALAIETYVREDQIKLFGFATDTERDWFRILLNVQGVGTKVALALLSTFKPADLATAIALKDVAAITRTPGVGKKLAERMVLDLKDKAPAFGSVDPAVMKLQGDIEEKRAPQPAREAISALVNLGYPQVQAATAVASAMRIAGDDAKTEGLIRLALKEMAKV